MKGKNQKNLENMVQKTNHDSCSSSENLVEAIVEVDVHENADGNFILHKFLNDTSTLLSKSPIEKPPVPLPRKLKSAKQDVSHISSIDEDCSTENMIQPHSSSSTSREKVKLKSSQDTAILIETSDDSRSIENELQNIESQEKPEGTVKYETNTKVSEEQLSLVDEKVIYDYNKLMAITIHKTERLLLDSLVVHPLVKIHIVEMSSGNYILKSDNNRAVIFYYENKDINYITPLLSEPYDLYLNHSAHPAWEEVLLINEDMTYILERNVIIFFELLDFVSFSTATSQAELEKGWHKIAWGFLKPLGKNGELNVNRKLRLQLYQSHKYKKVSPNICPMFHWWKRKKLIKYPSSLYVSVCEVDPPKKISKTLRSKTPIQPEIASLECLTVEQNLLHHKNSPLSTSFNSIQKHEEKLWSRLSYQTCKFPNRCIAEFACFKDGCFVLKFSNSGLYLACAMQIDTLFFIVIFSIKSLEELYRYSAHQGMIYNISWSTDDHYIITCSADCTAGIWNFPKRSFVEMLPHPCYVYASEVNKSNVVATGCYDNVVRIWGPSTNDSYDLLQELEGHKGYITSLCFTSKCQCLYSSDSVGVVREWRTENNLNNSWKSTREYKWIDLKDIIINQIALHIRERRLLIHARDSTLRLVDLKTGCTLQWLQGAVNNRFRTSCSFSPCGTYILAGGESGTVSVWNADLGSLVAIYEPYLLHNQMATIHCVQFHPYDNIMALAHYGYNLPVLLADYDVGISGNSSLGLKILQKNNEVRIGDKQISGSKKAEVSHPVQQYKVKLEDVMEKMNQCMEIQASKN